MILETIYNSLEIKLRTWIGFLIFHLFIILNSSTGQIEVDSLGTSSFNCAVLFITACGFLITALVLPLKYNNTFKGSLLYIDCGLFPKTSVQYVVFQQVPCFDFTEDLTVLRAIFHSSLSRMTPVHMALPRRMCFQPA